MYNELTAVKGKRYWMRIGEVEGVQCCMCTYVVANVVRECFVWLRRGHQRVGGSPAQLFVSGASVSTT